MSYMTPSSQEKPLFQKIIPLWHLFYSVHVSTFTRIRQHYFSKYWGDVWAVPHLKFCWGTVPQSPQVSAPDGNDGVGIAHFWSFTLSFCRYGAIALNLANNGFCQQTFFLRAKVGSPLYYCGSRRQEFSSLQFNWLAKHFLTSADSQRQRRFDELSVDLLLPD